MMRRPPRPTLFPYPTLFRFGRPTSQEGAPPHRFVDVQLRGPYALWHHTHDLADDGEGGTPMRDTVRYAIGFGPLGELAHRSFVARDLEKIFAFRQNRVQRWACADLRPPPASPSSPSASR